MDNYKAQLKTIKIIHLAIMGGATIFALVIALIITTNPINSEQVEILNYIPPAFLLLALVMHQVIFKTTVKPILKKETTLSQKLTAFQSGHIMRIALLEGVALFATVVALINGELLHLITVAVILAVMFKKLPTSFLLENELRLSREEKEQLS